MRSRRLDRLPVRRLPGGLCLFEASTPSARLRGLAGLSDLDPHHGLLLERCRSVQTFGMRFALDLVFLDEAGRVVRLAHAVGPARLRSCSGARSVIETHAGEGGRFARALEGGL